MNNFGEILSILGVKNVNAINVYTCWNELYFSTMVLPKRSYLVVLLGDFFSPFKRFKIFVKKIEKTSCFSFSFHQFSNSLIRSCFLKVQKVSEIVCQNHFKICHMP